MHIEKHDMIIRCLLILWNQRWREQQFRASYVVTSFLPRTLLINDLRELGSPSARSILITFATSVQNTTAQEKNGTLNWTKNWLTHFWRRKIFVCFSDPSTGIGSCNNVEKYTKSKKRLDGKKDARRDYFGIASARPINDASWRCYWLFLLLVQLMLIAKLFPFTMRWGGEKEKRHRKRIFPFPFFFPFLRLVRLFIPVIMNIYVSVFIFT